MNMAMDQIWLYLLCNLFAVYVHFRWYSVYFDRSSVNKVVEALSFLGLYVINSTTCIVFQNPIFNLCSVLIPLLLITLIYPTKMHIRIFGAIIGMGFIAVSEGVIFNGLTALGMAPSDVFILGSWTPNMCMFFCILVLAKLRTKMVHPRLDAIQWVTIIIIPLCSSLLMGYLLVAEYFVYTRLLISAVLLAINMLVFFLFDMLGKYYIDRYEQQLLNQQIAYYKESLLMVESSQKQIRTLNHDMKNHLMVMSQFTKDGQMEALGQYVSKAQEKLIVPVEK